MPDLTDFLEPLFTGRWKYLAGLIAGTAVLIVIRMIRYTWAKRQDTADAAFVEQYLTVPIESLKKKVKYISLSIGLLFVLLPATLWVTVEFLKKNQSLPDAQKALITFGLTLLFMLFIALQAVRLRRLRRRIKRIEKSSALPENTASAT